MKALRKEQKPKCPRITPTLTSKIHLKKNPCVAFSSKIFIYVLVYKAMNAFSGLTYLNCLTLKRLGFLRVFFSGRGWGGTGGVGGGEVNLFY